MGEKHCDEYLAGRNMRASSSKMKDLKQICPNQRL